MFDTKLQRLLIYILFILNNNLCNISYMLQENVCVYTILWLYYLYGSCSGEKRRLMNVVLKLNRKAESIYFIFDLRVVK